MESKIWYDSPLGRMLLSADEKGLTGAWFEGQKYFARGLSPQCPEGRTAVLNRAIRWLDCYFEGADPGPLPPLHLTGTDFQRAVWQALQEIPYGVTATYGQLAARIPGKSGAARAVGAAVGRNPVSVIVPCHRVVGASGSLTGYAGGIERKTALLQLEAEGKADRFRKG